MTMEDWANRIDKFLLADDRDVLKDTGKISHEIACDKALTEFEKYRVKQDKLYKSDFDLLLEEYEKNKKQWLKNHCYSLLIQDFTKASILFNSSSLIFSMNFRFLIS